MNSIVAIRHKDGDLYSITLEVPEKEYFEIYEDIDSNAGEDILKQYMTYHGDDGRYSDVGIKHDKGAHVVSIAAKIHYLGNDHTEQFAIPSHLMNKQ